MQKIEGKDGHDHYKMGAVIFPEKPAPPAEPAPAAASERLKKVMEKYSNCSWRINRLSEPTKVTKKYKGDNTKPLKRREPVIEYEMLDFYFREPYWMPPPPSEGSTGQSDEPVKEPKTGVTIEKKH